MPRLVCFLLIALLCWEQLSCSRKSQAPPRQVAVFTSLDQAFAEPIFRKFQEQTGIKVLPIYDEEASKTTAMINGIIASKGRPTGDVLWNNENVQTQRLAQMGLLESYSSPQALRYPQRFRDPQDRFTGFAARARIIIYNTRLVSDADAPRTLQELADPRWKGKVAFGRPFFGTCLTHSAVLYQAWGEDKFRKFLQALRANDVALCPGNGPVRDMVAAGERAVGVTDTDDAIEAIREGKVKGIIPDDQGGGLLIPNTVAILKGCKHSAEARALADYLLSARVERQLAQGPSGQIPLASDLRDQEVFWQLPTATLQYDLASAAASVQAVVMLLQQEKMDR